MKAILLVVLSAVLVSVSGCRENSGNGDASGEIPGSEAGAGIPADVLLVTNAIVDGELYSRPSFNGISLTHFDTSHQIQVLDTTDQLFVKARLIKDTTAFMGYVSKAILPEKN